MAAEETVLVFEREFDVSPAVLWDAIVDQELVAGWLGDAVIDAQPGGDYDLVWLTSASYPPTHGTIISLRYREALAVHTDNRGTIEFRLGAVPGVSSETGCSLQITVRLVIERAFIARVTADWLSNLDQLAGLLRGHPVDWGNWDRDHAAAWREYLRAPGDPRR